MAADLHIHVLKNMTECDLVLMQSNTLGSKHFNPISAGVRMEEQYLLACKKVMESPNVWVGEVSWLKAMVFEDEETFIPHTVQLVHDVIGEDLPVITDAMIVVITAAFGVENTTGYRLADVDAVVKFLKENWGRKIFTISW